MVQLVTGSLRKQDLSLSPGTHVKSHVQQCACVIPVLQGRSQEDAGAHWPALLSESMGSRSMERPCLNK